MGSRGNALISDILGRRVTIIWSAKSDAILSLIVVFTQSSSGIDWNIVVRQSISTFPFE